MSLPLMCLAPFLFFSLFVVLFVIVPLMVLVTYKVKKPGRRAIITCLVLIACSLYFSNLGKDVGLDMYSHHLRSYYAYPCNGLQKYISKIVKDRDTEALYRLAQNVMEKEYFFASEKVFEESEFSKWVKEVTKEQE